VRRRAALMLCGPSPSVNTLAVAYVARRTRYPDGSKSRHSAPAPPTSAC